MTPLVRLWIWLCAFASLAGWTLSLLGQLNRGAYAVAIAAFAIIAFLRRADLGFTPDARIFPAAKMRRRFSRRWPLCFALLAFLVCLGGAIYPPTHHTALTYHIPRVLHWIEADGWHWIHTPVVRMNYTGCDFEWLLTPLILFTHSYRFIFLINVVSFLLLPGLIFSVLTRLGVRGRVAWNWMWLFPCGYIFLLQAGSAGNDLFAVPFSLAAIAFASRAWQSRRAGDLWTSLLAMAVAVGIKPSGLPLLLPWTILVVPVLPVLRRLIVPTIAVSLLALVVSFVPLACLNKYHCGDWLGTSIEPSVCEVGNPLVGVTGNLFQLSVHNLVPPIFPLARCWNQHLPEFMPKVWMDNFQPGFAAVGELPNEDWTGMGFGVGWLLIISLAAVCFRRKKAAPSAGQSLIPPAIRWLVLLAPWAALLFFCAKSAMNTPARLVASYYPLLLPLLLAGAGQAQIVRKKWWQALAGMTLILALAVLVLSVDRPLWPARQTLARLAQSHPDSKLIARALQVYTVYSRRSDSMAPVRELLPPGIKVVGFMGTADDSDISLWLPFGSRRVEHFLTTDPSERFHALGVEYVVVGGFNLEATDTSLEGWLQKNGGEVIARTNVTQKVSEGAQPWYVVRLKP